MLQRIDRQNAKKIKKSIKTCYTAFFCRISVCMFVSNEKQKFINLKTKIMKTTERKAEMYKNIEEHGANLNAIFNTEFSNVVLCKKLHSLEVKTSRATTNLCNTNSLHYSDYFKGIKESSEEEQDVFFGKIMKSLVKILGQKAKECIFINRDPRGYALKIDNKYVRDNNLKIYRDWGGYGIIAPDFTPEKEIITYISGNGERKQISN